MNFDTKLAVIVREDLPVWQKLNVTAFLVSGISQASAEVIGENYRDGSGNEYLPMFRQPVLVFGADAPGLKKAYERGMSRGVRMAIFTAELFQTFSDDDNRAAVAACRTEDLDLVGLAFYSDKKVADKVVKGLSLCQ